MWGPVISQSHYQLQLFTNALNIYKSESFIHIYIKEYNLYFFYTDRLGLDLMLLARWPLCSLRSNIHGLAWSQIWRIPEFSEYLWEYQNIRLTSLLRYIFTPKNQLHNKALLNSKKIRNLCKIKKKVGCCPSSREITI